MRASGNVIFYDNLEYPWVKLAGFPKKNRRTKSPFDFSFMSCYLKDQGAVLPAD